MSLGLLGIYAGVKSLFHFFQKTQNYDEFNYNLGHNNLNFKDFQYGFDSPQEKQNLLYSKTQPFH